MVTFYMVKFHPHTQQLELCYTAQVLTLGGKRLENFYTEIKGDSIIETAYVGKIHMHSCKVTKGRKPFSKKKSKIYVVIKENLRKTIRERRFCEGE